MDEECSECGGPLLLAETTAGVLITLNPDPVPLGLLYVGEDGKVRPWKHTLGRSVKRYEQHAYNCPGKEEVEGEA